MTRPLVLVSQEVHDLGGMERAVLELIKAEHPHRHITVVAREVSADIAGMVEVERVRLPGRPMSLAFPLFFVLASLRVRRLKRARPDAIVHTVGGIIANRADVITVQYCHLGALRRTGRLAPAHAPVTRRLNTAVVHAMAVLAERWSYRRSRAEVLAAVSPGVAEEVRDCYPTAHVSLTPNAVDVQRFARDPARRAEARTALGVGESAVVALFVGGDWNRKGLDLIVHALQELRSSGLDVRLWVVGKGDTKRYTRIAKDRGVDDLVNFVGVTSDLGYYYSGADIFCLPTEYETFSMVAYEAAAAGLAVAATPVHGVTDLIGPDEDGGRYVRRDQADIARVLRDLAQNAPLRCALGTVALERSRGYSWARSTASVASIYENLTPRS